jgi:hypothetical protein
MIDSTEKERHQTENGIRYPCFTVMPRTILPT